MRIQHRKIFAFRLLPPRLCAPLLAFAWIGFWLTPSPFRAPTPQTLAQSAPEPPVQQLSTVQAAFDVLTTRYVEPIDSAELLGAGWAGLVREASRANAPAPGDLPPLTGDANANISTFKTSLSAYLTQSPGSDKFVPGQAVARAMAAHLHEAHTAFLTPQQYQDEQDSAEGSSHYVGIGTRMAASGSVLTVVEVFPNSPAADAGIQAGDTISAIDGQPVDSSTVSDAIDRVRGIAGTTVSITLQHPGSTDSVTIQLQRQEVVIMPVSNRLVDPTTGYVAVRGFLDPATVPDVEQAVDQLTALGATELIIDLRGNAGGRVDVGSRLLGDFLPAGSPLYQEQLRTGDPVVRTSHRQPMFTLPVAVLIDGDTASMGEIFAAAIQDDQAGIVVGSQSSGLVAGAEIDPLPDGSALEVTVENILSANGRLLNGVGVAPDQAVASSPGGDSGVGPDPVIALARDLLETNQD